jgi:regulator of sigma E protease
MFLTIITFILVLSVLVFVHEFGHFWVARKLGVKAEEFGFGFPPRIWGVYKDKNNKWKQVRGKKEIKDIPGTIYSINWIPVGGFVKIKGENGEGEDERDSFASRPIWQRTIVLLAGVTMNVILAMALISFGFMLGLPQALGGDINSKAEISDRQIQIVEVIKESPAAEAQLKLGDIILSVNENSFISSEKLQEYVDKHQGEQLVYQIKRGQGVFTKEITPEIREETNKGGIGIGIIETGTVKYPFFSSIWQGIKTTIFLTWAITVAFFELIKGLITGQGVSAEIAGPVGIAAITGQVARMGFIYILQFTALLSINLAIINAFPFPALDGGRILFLIIEKIKGSPVKREIEAVIHNVGFALLMLLIIVVTFKDVARFGDKFKMLWEKIIG